MGLDNFPNEYPCKTKNTAVLDDEDRINCKATQEAGGCPWLNANPPAEGRVYGMFGADCWYRGKYGSHLLDEAGIDDEDGFYGNEDDGCYKTPDSCLDLAEQIGETIVDVEDPQVRAGLIYAEWYLRWAAENTNGLACWY